MKCEHCGNCYQWKNAFSKFGYDDGDGNVITPEVAQVLEKSGYDVKFGVWQTHNTIIYSIKKDGWEYMPSRFTGHAIGYSDPVEYLPVDILKLLEKEFPTPILFR